MGGPQLPVDDGETELVRRAVRGETAAFARLVRLHHEALTRIALVVTLEPVSAAQAVRDAWPHVVAGLGRAEAHTPFVAWAASPVAAEAIHQAGRPRARGHVPAPRPGADPAGTAARLAALPARDRALAALHVLAELGDLDLARLEHRPAAETRARLERALASVDGPAALRAWSSVPVPPVDADATAAWAKGEAAFARNARWSVVAATAVGLFVAGLPYLARLLQGR